jgi:NTE family protein
MPPVRIDGRYFVDGGAVSTASVDLIRADEAEEIYVIAPMASADGVRAPGARRPRRTVAAAESDVGGAPA